MSGIAFKNFAYGSNMSIHRLRKRTPSAHLICVGRLYGHFLQWHKQSIDGSGKCDALETGESHDVVWGAVFEIAESERKELNRAEGLGWGYEEKIVTIQTSNGSLKAQMFFAIRINSSLQPYQWYKQHVLRGARELGLPDEYIKKIVAIDATQDLDSNRSKREMQ